ncbi:glucan synthase [Wallemia mellicola]|nr:glucan synthase [Wallemia mellicola]
MRSSSRDLNVDTDVSPASLLSQPEQYAEYEDIDDLSAYRYPTTLKRTIDNIYTDTGKHYDEYNDSSESLIGDGVFGPTIATNVATDSGYPPWRVQPPTPSTSVPPQTLFNSDIHPSHEEYLSWSSSPLCPITITEIESIFHNVSHYLGFQSDASTNAFEMLMRQLDSRASRMQANQALMTLHADYIGGEHANFKRWFFAAQLDLDDAIGTENNPGMAILGEAAHEVNATFGQRCYAFLTRNRTRQQSLRSATERWRTAMEQMTSHNRIVQMAIFLLCWTEAGNIRFMPECLCYIFKCANDHYTKIQQLPEEERPILPQGYYLRSIIRPLYRYYRDQVYELVDGRYLKRENDHDKTIGYDDINQLFWYPEGINRIHLLDGTRLTNIRPDQRFRALASVKWDQPFYKSFKEKRTFAHLLVDYNRIWIAHVAVYWFFTAYNAHEAYKRDWEPLPARPMQISASAMGGAVSSFIMILGTIAEFSFLPLNWNHFSTLIRKLLLYTTTLVLCIGPTYYIATYERDTPFSLTLAKAHLAFAIFITAFYTLVPSGRILGDRVSSRARKYVASQTFTASYPKLDNSGRFTSIALWILVFGCKYIESYCYLSLSSKDPMAALMNMRVQNCSDALVGEFFCTNHAKFTLAIMIIMDLVLFFLDTYLWYVIWSTFISVSRSFALGLSIWTPWRDLFRRVPSMIYSKLLVPNDLPMKPKLLAAQVWNLIVLSMYHDHLLSIEHVQKLLYVEVQSKEDGRRTYESPPFFVDFDQKYGLRTEFLPTNAEAERRISFFARSLAIKMPEAIPVPEMPCFTVLVPHYSEKMLLSLREIIREEDETTRVSLLEYLKQLHPVEWSHFIRDTRTIAEESGMYRTPIATPTASPSLTNLTTPSMTPAATPLLSPSSTISGKASPGAFGAPKTPPVENLHRSFSDSFASYNMKAKLPDYTLRTRIWASIRAQTLYRTISGFMNYHKAIKLLYHVETPDLVDRLLEERNQSSDSSDDSQKLGVKHGERSDYDDLNEDVDQMVERSLDIMARRKFKFIVSMQRYSKFNAEERENVEILLKTFPDLQIAYIEEVVTPDEDDSSEFFDEIKYYSVLIDGHCDKMPNGTRKPRMRIELPGNPILGDGKSDNQNHALIFYRGEYLQLIDANQDNYLEECLKIRNVLGEFESFQTSRHSPYSNWGQDDFYKKPPVAIVGAREYIFSENVGILGDIAAGKEQTFGTMAARALSHIGGKLHYGHPDFLNAIFMTTRGGVAKAQKGLHLNEDIFGGMTAFNRGGRIKHAEYYQCGKGRDLGFGTILNFQTKIGTGMGEQMISREYYYLGTQLPTDRFLTFYYGHGGFHVNNTLVIFSVQIITVTLLLLGTLNETLEDCKHDDNGDYMGGQPGCYNLYPVYEWIKRTIISIFLVFMIAFLPLFMHELMDRGAWKAFSRLTKQFMSLSPIFEVFSTQIYRHSIVTSLTFGGARYIATGRGFATTRISFPLLFSRFAGPSIYMGMRTLLMLTFISLSMWVPHLIYFWFSGFALALAPFAFNPHQFSLHDFIIDYREYLHWMSRGNAKSHSNSWISFCRLSRTRVTGYRKKILGLPSEKYLDDSAKAGWQVVLFSEIVWPAFMAFVFTLAYMFMNSIKNEYIEKPSMLIRILYIAFAPIALNAVVLVSGFLLSYFYGRKLSTEWEAYPAAMATFVHAVAVLGQIVTFEYLWYLENWRGTSTLLGIIASMAIQRAVVKSIVAMFLGREIKNDETNRAWWSGKWWYTGLGQHIMTHPLREFFAKLAECSLFTADFLLCHILFFILAIPTLIPGFDRIHSTALFWLKPSKQIRPPIYSRKIQIERRRVFYKYGFIYLIIMSCLASTIIIPLFYKDIIIGW